MPAKTPEDADNNVKCMEKRYAVKFLFLFLSTFTGIFAVWYGLMRDRSVDWISSQIAHQISPYAILETEDGLIASNVVLGYAFNLPQGFRTSGSRNLKFFLEDGMSKKCVIRHYRLNSAEAGSPEFSDGKLLVQAGENKLVFELVEHGEIGNCGKYLRGIKDSLRL